MYTTHNGDCCSPPPPQDQLVPVFENGVLLREYTFEEVRERAELAIVKRYRPQEQ